LRYAGCFSISRSLNLIYVLVLHVRNESSI